MTTNSQKAFEKQYVLGEGFCWGAALPDPLKDKLAVEERAAVWQAAWSAAIEFAAETAKSTETWCCSCPDDKKTIVEEIRQKGSE